MKMKYTIKKKYIKNQEYIFDPIRKKYLINTPEEWVRQNFIHYLHTKKGYPLSLISTETLTKLNNKKCRSDIICYNRNGKPILIVECKASEIKITTSVFDQVQNYNSVFKTNYIIITNGKKTICFKITKSKAKLMTKVPSFLEIKVFQNMHNTN